MAATAPPPTRDQLEVHLQVVLDNSASLTAVAARMGGAYTTLRRKVADGRVPAFRLGRDMRMWLPDVDELLAGEL